MEKNCRNCGAPLDHHKSFCEYCGTPTDNWLMIKPPTITITPHDLETLKCGVFVNKEMVDVVGYSQSTEYVKDVLTRKMAEGLIDYMDIRSEYDPIQMSYNVSGRIRVLNEKTRFTA